MPHPVPEWLSAFVDQALRADEQARIADHLDQCPSCVEQTVRLRAAKSFLMAAPRHTLPRDVLSTMQARLEREKRSSSTWRDFFVWPRLWVPAGVLAGVVAVGIFFGRSALESREALPLEMLLAAHSRYSADAVAADTDVVAANFSMRVDEYESRDN